MRLEAPGAGVVGEVAGWAIELGLVPVRAIAERMIGTGVRWVGVFEGWVEVVIGAGSLGDAAAERWIGSGSCLADEGTAWWAELGIGLKTAAELWIETGAWVAAEDAARWIAPESEAARRVGLGTAEIGASLGPKADPGRGAGSVLGVPGAVPAAAER